MFLQCSHYNGTILFHSVLPRASSAFLRNTAVNDGRASLDVLLPRDPPVLQPSTMEHTNNELQPGRPLRLHPGLHLTQQNLPRFPFLVFIGHKYDDMVHLRLRVPGDSRRIHLQSQVTFRNKPLQNAVNRWCPHAAKTCKPHAIIRTVTRNFSYLPGNHTHTM